ncbi:Patatin [Candidatus Terasakiella magnetica]|uniref:Patatin n=1 Tax=Candidatus Terasakiella magnetica TaxID=1867952 RepID=A0A1C3RIS4_9PROT|nr:patatin-like phospholipase family protein [Candidatus Terasakiella magnetica]SCA57166.1 Patatin [Candidatus Terasakiella magnetica]
MSDETPKTSSSCDHSHKQINLALQGGGAHGAYTWGVLDRLLEDDFMSYDTLSGTSAGAVNAVAFAQGYMEDGAAGAGAKLEEVWKAISKAGDFLSIPQTPMELMSKAMSGFFAPFDHNPLDYDPLRDILKKHINFEDLRKHSPVSLYVAATQVSNGKARLFETQELTIEMVLASSCLPFLSKSVLINGDPFWDGGFSANPAVRPLVLDSNTDDTLLIQISPVDDFMQMPSHIAGMRTHLNHLSFSESLRHEIEVIEEEREQAGTSPAACRLRNHHFHLIDGSPVTSRLNPGSEMTPDWKMLSELFIKGREACEVFLEQDREKIAQHSSIDLKEHFGL